MTERDRIRRVIPGPWLGRITRSAITFPPFTTPHAKERTQWTDSI